MSDLETLSEQLTKMIQLHVNPALGVDENKARLIVALDLLCTLQQHEATIAERDSRIAELLETLHFRESASSDLAAAQATIQQQARELETADKALEKVLTQNECDMVLTGDEIRQARAALARIHSARAASEAKKDER